MTGNQPAVSNCLAPATTAASAGCLMRRSSEMAKNCARTVRALVEEGVRAFYISNLPLVRTSATLQAILDKAGL